MAHLAAAVLILFVMVLLLLLVGLLQLRAYRGMALRITYLEGTLDMVHQSQEQMLKMIVAYMQSDT